MTRDRLFHLIDTEADQSIGRFASLAECRERIRRHGLTAYAIWQGSSLVESACPDADDDTPSAPVLMAIMQTLGARP